MSLGHTFSSTLHYTGPVSSSATPIKAIQAKGWASPLFFFLVEMRSITKHHSPVSSLLCNIRSPFYVELLDQDRRGKPIRPPLARIRSLFTERVKNNPKNKTHWLYTLCCALQEAQDPNDNPVPGRVPGYPRCIMFSFVIDLQTMSCR